MSQIRRSRLYFCMELDRWRGSESEQDGELHETLAPVGKRSLTSRLGAPSLVLRVEDVTVARALGEAIRGGRGPIQRDAEPGRDGNGVAANAEAAVERAASGSGEPLRADLRERFEASLGADLSAVRVHRGAASAEASHAVGAKAYTVGNDIHFSEGRYQPDDPFGLHLLAHEVAHTVQQSGGAVARQHKLEVSTPADALEGEADRAADAMVRGARATVSGGGAQLAREKGDGEKGEKVDEKGPWTAPTADTVPHESVDPRVRKEKPASADKVWNPPPPVGWHYFPNGKTPPVAGVQLCTAQKTRPLGTFIQVLIDGQLWAVRTEWHNFTTKFDADKKPYNVPGVYQGANLMQLDQQPAELPKGPDLGKKGAPAPAPKSQNKLEVSGPVDASEVEADRAADAMVRGARAVVSGGGAHLARDYGGVDPDAGPAEKKVEGVRYARADGTKVYDRAGKKQTEVETLSMGAEVKLLTEGGGYYKCTTLVGNTGYVTTGSVSETRPEKKEEKKEKKEEKNEEKAPDKADDKAATPDKVDKNGPWTPPKPTRYPDESIDPRVPTKEPASPKDVWNPSPPVGYEYIPTDKSPPGSHDLATKSLSKPVGTFIQTILNGKLVGVRTEYHAGNLVKEGDKWVVKNVVKKGVSLMMATEQPKDLPKTADGDKKADPGATRRQNKLEVSGPVDASELEADRAADAMVRGQRAPIASAPTFARARLRRHEPRRGPARDQARARGQGVHQRRRHGAARPRRPALEGDRHAHQGRRDHDHPRRRQLLQVHHVGGEGTGLRAAQPRRS
ncbi:MAG: DUF4157 domain-containing protein [Myxococcales bacterium]|nr:DUF4157 domain-containing protein [Myxococcales bacterium]